MNDVIELERTLSLLNNGDAMRLAVYNLVDMSASELMVIVEDLVDRLQQAEYMIAETISGRDPSDCIEYDNDNT
jgi:hypothetical protein